VEERQRLIAAGQDHVVDISRAQAYRLLDVARALAAIHGAVTAVTAVTAGTAGTRTSRTRDTGPAEAAALDYGRSQRALTVVPAEATTSRS
jgi:hypothetical protein